MTNWDKEASLILKAELTRRDINYRVLASRLAAIGVIDSEGAIANKISRGSFRMSFFLQCMKAIGVETVSVATQDPE
ncbi:MAG: hypothetical protein EAZ11_10405 [Curvibacter sp.]|nr:MAG: hypothetical protein EAZ11_10405 [Curvibacter sp.]